MALLKQQRSEAELALQERPGPRPRVAEVDGFVERKFLPGGIPFVCKAKRGWERGSGVLGRVVRVWEGLGDSPNGIALRSQECNSGQRLQTCGDAVFPLG